MYTHFRYKFLSVSNKSARISAWKVPERTEKSSRESRFMKRISWSLGTRNFSLAVRATFAGYISDEINLEECVLILRLHFRGYSMYRRVRSSRARKIVRQKIQTIVSEHTMTRTYTNGYTSTHDFGKVEKAEKWGKKYRQGLTSFVPIWPILPIVVADFAAGLSAATGCWSFSLAIGILAGFDKNTLKIITRTPG